jgi:hypothetical protein
MFQVKQGLANAKVGKSPETRRQLRLHYVSIEIKCGPIWSSSTSRTMNLSLVDRKRHSIHSSRLLTCFVTKQEMDSKQQTLYGYLMIET